MTLYTVKAFYGHWLQPLRPLLIRRHTRTGQPRSRAVCFLAAVFLRVPAAAVIAEFLQSQAIQILIGLLCILFSLTAIFSPVLIYHAPLCIGVIFIISGSVALKAKRNTSVASVWWTLILNLLSVIFSLGGVAYLSWCFAAVLPTVIVCGEEMNPQPYDPYGRQFNCNERLWLLDVVVHGLWGFYLVLLVFQACVSITLVVFSGKAIRHSVHYGPVQVLVSDYDSDVGLLDPEPSTPTLDSP